MKEERLFNMTTEIKVDSQRLLQTTDGNSCSGEKYPADPITSDTAQLVISVVHAGILPVLTSCGVIMNVINMVVFLRQGLSDRINLCLFSLAMSDTGYITTSMTSRLYTILGLVDPALVSYWQWKVQFQRLIGIYAGFLGTSNCLTLLISIERCVCVLWPLKAKTLLSVRNMAVVIVFIYLGCMCCGGLGAFKYNNMRSWDPDTNSTVYYTKPARFYERNPLPVDIIFDTIYGVILPTVCLSGVMVATLLISLRMRAVLSWRMQTAHVGSAGKTQTSPEQRDRLVTRMLMVVCVVFTVCTIPYAVHAFCRFYMPSFDISERYNNTFFVTIGLAHCMTTINSSGNFLIYWTMSTKFRDTLCSLLRCHMKHAQHVSEH